MGGSNESVGAPEAPFEEQGERARSADFTLVDRLLRRDEQAFVELVDRLHPAMVRLAHGVLLNRPVAEEVAQEAWQAVLEHLPSFEGRCTLKTWILRITLNRAKTRAGREKRVATTDVGSRRDNWDDSETRPDEFGEPEIITPESQLLTAELNGAIEQALAGVPESYRLVLTLRDIEGLSASEACATLGISEANQRVILHRARLKVRKSLAYYLDGDHARKVSNRDPSRKELGAAPREACSDETAPPSSKVPAMSRGGR